MVDLADLAVTQLASGDAHLLELVTPFVLRSEFPNIRDTSVPWWWHINHDDGLRHREEVLLRQCESYRLSTIDHGQVVGYSGDRPIETALNGITHVGTHSKYGFGEFRLTPIEG